MFAFINKMPGYSKPPDSVLLNPQSLYKQFILENSITPQIGKFIIDKQLVENVNFSRMCEFRSKALFKLHRIEL